MRFTSGPSDVLYAAPNHGHCRVFLPKGLPTSLLPEGFGCFTCNLDDLAAWDRHRVWDEAERLLEQGAEEEQLLRRAPDDCSRPARRLRP